MKGTHRQIKKLLLTAVLGLMLLTLKQTTYAQTKTFYWERFDVDITLLENGNLRVVETQTLHFSGGTFSFGFGTIPLGRAGNNDGITDIEVREGDIVYHQLPTGGVARTFTVSQEEDEVFIKWYFTPTTGSHTYTFSYTVLGGVRVGAGGEDGDQIFWKAIPSDRGARVENSTVTIHLPEGVAPQRYTDTNNYLVAAYINGAETNRVSAQVSDNGRTITYTLLEPLQSYDLLEVRVQFPHEALNLPTPEWQKAEQRSDTISLIVLVISLLVLVGGPILVIMLWYLFGRDPQLPVVVPEYVTEPPSSLPPAVVGTLVDEKADMRDIISTLIDLAARGYMTIEEERGNHIFRRTDKPANDLRPFEQQFLRDIFGGRVEQSLSDLRYKFYNKLPRQREMLYEELVNEGLMRRSPQSIRTGYGLLGGFVLFLAFGAFGLLGAIFGEEIQTLICLPMAIGVTAVALLIVSRFMPAKTAKGAEEAAKWEAFRNYLKNIDKLANLAEAKDIFEKYLPYATAFGMERSWINKFASVPGTAVPPWYRPYGYPRPGYGPGPRPLGKPIPGGGGMPSLDNMAGGLSGGLNSMASSLTRMLNSASTVMRSTPPASSGSGGSRGGGFSGGGFSGGFSGGSSGGGGSRGFG